MTTTLIDTVQLRSELAVGPDLRVVDVRMPAEHRSAHIPGAVNLPLEHVEAHRARIAARPRGRIVLVCESGGRARRARDLLVAAGADDVHVLDGGMRSWLAARGPVDRADASGPWSIERQIRLVAGAIVLGSITASVAWPRARFLAGGIGAGLTFAALSDTCPMGALLSRLPYNAAADADIAGALEHIAA